MELSRGCAWLFRRQFCDRLRRHVMQDLQVCT